MFLTKENLRILIEEYLFEDEEDTSQEKNVHVVYLNDLPNDWGVDENKIEIKLYFQDDDKDKDNKIEVSFGNTTETLTGESNKNKLLAYVHIALAYSSGPEKEKDVEQLLRMVNTLGEISSKDVKIELEKILATSKPAAISSIVNTSILKGSALRTAAQSLINKFTKSKVV